MATDVNMHPKAKVTVPKYKPGSKRVALRTSATPQKPKLNQIKQRLR